MSTMSAVPEPTGSEFAAASAKLSSLLTAFWYKTRALAAPVFTVVVGLARTVATPVLVLMAPPVGALLVAGTLSTAGGRAAAGRAVNWLGWAGGWVVRKVAQVVHNVIDWVGHGIAGLAELVNKEAGLWLHDRVNAFSANRELFAGWVRTKVSNAIDAVQGAANTRLVNGIVGVTAVGIVLLIATFFLAPALMGPGLAAITTPWIMNTLTLIAAGSPFAVEMALLSSAVLGVGLSLLNRRLNRPAVEPVAEVAEPETEPKAAKKVAAAKVADEVHVITDVAEPDELVPGVTPISEENAAALRKEAEAGFKPGPGKHDQPPKPSDMPKKSKDK